MHCNHFFSLDSCFEIHFHIICHTLSFSLFMGKPVHNELTSGCLCDEYISEKVIFSEDLVIPISKDLLHAMSYAVQEKVDEGAYTKLQSKFKSERLGTPGKCGAEVCKRKDLRKPKPIPPSKKIKKSESFEEMDIYNLSFPILISVLATSFTLAHFLWYEHFNHILYIFFYGGTKRGQVMSYDDHLRGKLVGLPASALLKRLRNQNVSKDALNQAVNSLPDTSYLVELVFECSCSDEAKDILFLHKLEFSELHNMLISNNEVDIGTMYAIGEKHETKSAPSDFPTNEEINTAINNTESPKKKLIELVLSSSSARALAKKLREDSTIGTVMNSPRRSCP